MAVRNLLTSCDTMVALLYKKSPTIVRFCEYYPWLISNSGDQLTGVKVLNKDQEQTSVGSLFRAPTVTCKGGLRESTAHFLMHLRPPGQVPPDKLFD